MAHTSLTYFKQVFSVVTQFNVSEEDCLRATGLSEIPRTGRVDANTISSIFKFAANELNDSLIAIKCALKYPLLQYTRPAEILKFCKDISHAAEIYRTYCPLFHTVGNSSCVISENGTDRMIWIPNFDSEHIDFYRLNVEFIMTNYMTSINWLAWNVAGAVRQLSFRHDAIMPIQHYQDLLGCDVKFGQSEYSILLNDQVKDAPFATYNPTALAKIRVNLDKALNELYATESLIDRVELQIRNTIEYRIPNKTIIAKALGLSERSLARALTERGTCFKDIKNRVMREIANAKLNQGLTLAEIAYSLGYNDQAAFTRAYTKWFGLPPGKSRSLYKVAKVEGVELSKNSGES